MFWLIGVAAMAGGAGWWLGRRSSASQRMSVEPRRHESAQADERILRAVETLSLGFVLYDGSGQEVFQNSSAFGFGSSRHQRPLVEVALADTARLAAAERQTVRTLDLYGPPRQVLEFTGAAVVIDSAFIGVVVIIEDITEKRRTVEVRRDFVANVSHELKTPVGAMGLLAEALCDTDDPSVVARLGGRLHAEALRLGNTIDDLLALSEIESGELSHRGPVDPSVVIAGALERCSASSELRSITIGIDDRTANRKILGDRRQLLAAVGNLVDNAVKYSDSGSEVSVVASVDHESDRICIEVTDSGIGIPPADRDRIFERFYRVDPARSRNTGGTGLGLSIVRNVVSNHGGEVQFDSVEGQGSTFRLFLPVAEENAPARSLVGGS